MITFRQNSHLVTLFQNTEKTPGSKVTWTGEAQSLWSQPKGHTSRPDVPANSWKGKETKEVPSNQRKDAPW